MPNERFSTVVTVIYTNACMYVCVCLLRTISEYDWYCKMILRAAYLYNTVYCCCAKNNDAKINTWQSSEYCALFRAFAYFVDRIEWIYFIYVLYAVCVCVCGTICALILPCRMYCELISVFCVGFFSDLLLLLYHL